MNKLTLISIILFITIGVIYVQLVECSSLENARIAHKYYHDSPLEQAVAHLVGDRIPQMRDELITRKLAGQGFLYRHLRAWTKPTNWIPRNNFIIG